MKHEGFSQMEEANGLQFSLTMEVLPSNNLKIGSICQDKVVSSAIIGTVSSR